jgi:hypothetical protein
MYRDVDPDPRRSLVVAGAGRSGTTWLAEMLTAAAPSRQIFEPFNHEFVGEPARDYELHYARPGEPDADLRAFLDKVFSGRLRGVWVDRYVDCLRPRYRVVKMVRANLMLGWIVHEYPLIPILFVIRHPCAVVLSRMEHGWDPDKEIRLVLAQPALGTDHLGELYEGLRHLRSREEKHAAIWGVCNRVPLCQPERAGLKVFRYENLVDRPDTEVPALFRAAGLTADDRILKRVPRASQTSSPWHGPLEAGERKWRWTQVLNADQIRRILAVAHEFGPEESEWLN